jgi:hypothetical protein
MVVLAREQERGPLPIEVLLELRGRPIQLCGQLLVTRFLDELEGRQQIVDASLETAPQIDLGAEAVGLAKGLLRAALVVPEPGLAGQRLKLGDALFLGLEVKDAPTSTGSARPGREWWRRPLSCGPGGPGAGSDGAR